MDKNVLQYNNYLTRHARELRKNSTLSEVLLWKQLQRKQLLGYKFTKQKPIDNYIVDFYCKELSLVIEIDGLTHDFKITEDRKRDMYLTQLGLRILRIPDREVKKDITVVIQWIVDFITKIKTS